MNTPFLDSDGNPMEKGYFYSITVNHTVFPEIQYLSKKTGTQMMRFTIISDLHRDRYALLIRYDPNNRPKRLNRNKTNITDNEDESDNDFADDNDIGDNFDANDYLGGKSKKNTIKRRKRISNKRRKSNKKKKRRSIKRRK